jgi:transposase-like protein
MVKRKRYDQTYKEAIVAEMLGGKSAAQIAQREQIAAHTLYKWKEKIASGDFADAHRTEIELRRRIRELEGAVSELALENHIIKKARQIMADELRKERWSKRISQASSVSSKAAQR